MPNHISQQIASLRRIAETGLHQDHLAQLVSECARLAQDSRFVLTFFVLGHLFSDLDHALDEGPVEFERFEELTQGLVVRISTVLTKLEHGEDARWDELQGIVSLHLRNLGLFRTR